MKAYQKLVLTFLSTSFLLAGLGYISLRINSVIKQDTNDIINNSLPEVQGAREMAQALQSIQAASQELLLETNESALAANNSQENQSDIQTEIIRSQKTIMVNLSKFENGLATSKKSTVKFINLDSKEATEATELEEFGWLSEIEKEFYSYKNQLDRYVSLSQVNPDLAFELLESEVEPQLRKSLMPLVMQYLSDALAEMESNAREVNKSAFNDDIIIVSFSIISIFISLGLGGFVSYSIQKTTVSQSYLDNILSSINDSLIVISFDGTILKVNQSTLKLLEYESNELLEQNIKLIFSDKSLQIDPLKLKNFLGNYESTYLTQTGNEIPVAFSSSFILGEDGSPQGIVCLARDITDKYLAEKALLESENRYALAARATKDGLFDWNLCTNKIYFSTRWKSMLGYEDAEIENTLEQWFALVHRDHINSLQAAIDTHLKSNLSQFEITYPMLAKDGSIVWMQTRAIKVRDKDGVVIRVAGSQTDITKARALEAQLRYDALHDRLTELANRTYFRQELDTLFNSNILGKNLFFAVLFIDLDGFKQINDSLGHEFGDLLLIAFARKIKKHLKHQDLFARLGGDEFAILLKSLELVRDVTSVAQRILDLVCEPFVLQGHEIFISASIGIALSSNDYHNADEILRDADAAMYKAKKAGKARYIIFKPPFSSLNSFSFEEDFSSFN